jgi:hypothetical protein
MVHLEIYHLCDLNYSSEVILIWYNNFTKWELIIDNLLLSNNQLDIIKYEINNFI